VRDHWHTMTRTGKTARLSAHYAEPFVEINPADASRFNIRGATLARISNGQGSAILRAIVTDRQPRGQLFAPMHWTEQFSSDGRIDALVRAKTDPVSGQPALKMAQCHIEPVRVRLYGFFVSRQPPSLAGLYWAIAPTAAGTRGELAWFEEPSDWETWLRTSFDLPQTARLRSLVDERSGRRSYAVLDGGRLILALYASPDPVIVSRQWAAELLGAEGLAASTVLAGRPGGDMPDKGAVVCSCFSVGTNTIAAAIAEQGCDTVEAIGHCTKAGTNCGSCRPEIRRIIERQLASVS